MMFFLSLAVAYSFAQESAVQQFIDLSEDHPSSAALLELVDDNVLQGYSDGTIRPDAYVNRAEFTKMVSVSLNGQYFIDTCEDNMIADGKEKDLYFHDVAMGAWYKPYLCAGIATGAINGFPDKTFRASHGITFAEAAKILSVSFGMTERDAHKQLPDSAWHTPYVTALGLGIEIPTSIDRLSQYLTRGETAELLTAAQNWRGEPVYASSFTTNEDNSVLLESYTSPQLKAAAEAQQREIEKQTRIANTVISWTEFSSRTYGFSILHPNLWPEPHILTRGIVDYSGIYGRSDWGAYLGPELDHCQGFSSCVQRDIVLNGYSRQRAEEIVDLIYSNPSITVTRADTSRDDRLTIYMEENEGCTTHSVAILTFQGLYRFSATCSEYDERLKGIFDEIVESFEDVEIRDDPHWY